MLDEQAAKQGIEELQSALKDAEAQKVKAANDEAVAKQWIAKLKTLSISNNEGEKETRAGNAPSSSVDCFLNR